MLCQICNKNPATIHVQEIINGEKKVFHLCGECASKKAETEPILQSFNLAEMLYNFTNEKAAESADAPEDAAPAAAVIAMLVASSREDAWIETFTTKEALCPKRRVLPRGRVD